MASEIQGPPPEVLLVEAVAEQADAVREALEGLSLRFELSVVTTAMEAVERARSPRRPDLILLNVDNPCGQGQAALRTLKADPATAWVPVIVLGAALVGCSVKDLYDEGANAFVPRPIEPGALASAVQAIGRFWLQTVRLPMHEW